MPKETFLELMYRSHLEYIGALRKSMAEPENEVLLDKVDEEDRKMNVVN